MSRAGKRHKRPRQGLTPAAQTLADLITLAHAELDYKRRAEIVLEIFAVVLESFPEFRPQLLDPMEEMQYVARHRIPARLTRASSSGDVIDSFSE
jgi:hypothetical protein